MSSPDEKVAELAKLRDKCHMIVEAFEDACLDVGSDAHMWACYGALKGLYSARFGPEELRQLIQSMEPPPVITSGDDPNTVAQYAYKDALERADDYIEKWEGKTKKEE